MEIVLSSCADFMFVRRFVKIFPLALNNLLSATLAKIGNFRTRPTKPKIYNKKV